MYEALMSRLIGNALQNTASVPDDIKADLMILQDPSSTQQERLDTFGRLE